MPELAKDANQVIEFQLTENLNLLEDLFSADCFTYVGPIAFGADDDIRDAIESIDNKRDKLFFILETPGGFAETARRIADTVRHHYEVVNFLVLPELSWVER